MQTLIVTAPLNITVMNKDLASDTVYVYDYNESELKGEEFINYVQQIGGISDIIFNKSTSFKDKDLLLYNYISNPVELNYYHFIMTFIDVLFTYKNIDIDIEDSLFTKTDCREFITKHQLFITRIAMFLDSLLPLMVMKLSANTTIDKLKIKYNSKQISYDEIEPNVLHCLKCKEFWDYYKNGIDKDNIFYYDKIFKNKFEKILFNENNFVWEILLGMKNKQFQDFLKEKSVTTIN